ncbi:hypothetical protein [Streptomyces sp. NPDC020597]
MQLQGRGRFTFSTSTPGMQSPTVILTGAGVLAALGIAGDR